MGSITERLISRFSQFPIIRKHIESHVRNDNPIFSKGDILIARKSEKGVEPFLLILRPVAVIQEYYMSRHDANYYYKLTMFFDEDNSVKEQPGEIHTKEFVESHFQLTPKGTTLEQAANLYNIKK
jgi:hypothetical protein